MTLFLHSFIHQTFIDHLKCAGVGNIALITIPTFKNLPTNRDKLTMEYSTVRLCTTCKYSKSKNSLFYSLT